MNKLFIIILTALFVFNVSATEEKLEKLTLSGPFAAVSNPLIRMMDIGALDDVAKQMEFKIWTNPGQMRALALKGDVDFIATPSNVAANLYNPWS